MKCFFDRNMFILLWRSEFIIIIAVLFRGGFKLLVFRSLFIWLHFIKFLLIRLLIILIFRLVHRAWPKMICSVFVVVFTLNKKVRYDYDIMIILLLKTIIYFLTSSWNEIPPPVTSRRLHHSSFPSNLSNILNNSQNPFDSS